MGEAAGAGVALCAGAASAISDNIRNARFRTINDLIRKSFLMHCRLHVYSDIEKGARRYGLY